MIKRQSECLLLGPEELTPSRDGFKVIGTFNPGAVRVNDEIVLLVRVAERPLEHRSGFVGLPRHVPGGNIMVDWVPEEELDQRDSRVVRHRADNRVRLTSLSHLRVFRRHDASSQNWVPGPIIFPVSPSEEFGIEDPRITKMDGKYWITYVAVSRHGASTALASTDDMSTFDRHGLIFCPENKDVVLFPRKVAGQFVAFHRPNPNTHFGPPEIWLARSPNLLHWGEHECLYRGSAEWESDRVGAGTPPILLKEGWLAIYHGSQRAERVGDVGAYSAGALLLDRDNPARILRRSHTPIMQPTTDFERSGFVDNVIFPTAMIEDHDTLSVYYGAADTYTGVVEFSRKETLAALS